MSVFVLALQLICVAGISFKFKDGFEDYMSPSKTGAIKGIFVVIVFFSHVRQYITVPQTGMNAMFYSILVFLGQLMVVMFLFYSGYGISVSVAKKDGYVKTIPKRRILKVWLDFAIAVTIFFFVSRAIGVKYEIKHFLWSLAGLKTVGNSNWFIFVIIILYILTFIAFAITGGKKHIIAGIVVTTVLSVVATVVLWHFFDKHYWWYDTVMCYPLGMWYYVTKPYIDKKLLGSFDRWFAAVAASAICFSCLKALLSFFKGSRAVFIPMSFVFAIGIVILSMRVSVNNAVLRWFGSRVFGIYILQRIPMMILRYFGYNDSPIVFTAVCFAITILLAEIFERSTAKLDEWLHITPKKLKK